MPLYLSPPLPKSITCLQPMPHIRGFALPPTNSSPFLWVLARISKDNTDRVQGHGRRDSENDDELSRHVFGGDEDSEIGGSGILGEGDKVL